MVERVNKLINISLATSTNNVYKRAWTLFAECMKNMKINFKGLENIPLTISQIVTFIGYLSCKGFSGSTITSYITAIGYIHKILNKSNPTTSTIVQKMLASCNKLHSTIDNRLPITLNILHKLNNALKYTIKEHYFQSLFRAMYTFAFFGLMRLAEITQEVNGLVPLLFNQVELTSSSIIVKIKNFKHNKSLENFQIVLQKQKDSSICPVIQLVNYIKMRGSQQGPLFRFPDGTPLTRHYFNEQLRNTLQFIGLNTNLYKSHSFRIGGATYYAELGLSDAQLRTLGRWKSEAFLRYIRTQRMNLAMN